MDGSALRDKGSWDSGAQGIHSLPDTDMQAALPQRFPHIGFSPPTTQKTHK